MNIYFVLTPSFKQNAYPEHELNNLYVKEPQLLSHINLGPPAKYRIQCIICISERKTQYNTVGYSSKDHETLVMDP